MNREVLAMKSLTMEYLKGNDSINLDDFFEKEILIIKKVDIIQYSKNEVQDMLKSNYSIDTYIDIYLNHQKTSNYSNITIDSQQKRLRQFKRYLLDNYLKSHDDLRELRTEELLAYLKHNVENKTNERRTSKEVVVKGFFNKIIEMGIYFDNPLEKIYSEDLLNYNNIELGELQILSRQQLAEVKISLTKGRSEFNLRARIIINICLETGATPTELLDIKTKDIDLRSNTITIHTAKTKKKRTVKLTEDLIKDIIKYRERYSSITNTNQLLTTLVVPIKPLKKEGLRKIFRRVSTNTNIEITTAILRHTLVDYLLSKFVEHKHIASRIGVSVRSFRDLYIKPIEKYKHYSIVEEISNVDE